MKKTLKKYFIPHQENNYHPYILHHKRLVLYGSLFVAIKVIVVIFVLVLPMQAFLLPDVLLAQQRLIVALTNDLRQQKGLLQLAVENKLNISAQAKAQDMAAGQYFSHARLDGKTAMDWIEEAGYAYKVAGENLAMGFPSAEEVVNAWIKSPTHYSNLIDPDYKVIGVGLEGGLYDGQETVYLAQHLAAPQQLPVNSVTPAVVNNALSGTVLVDNKEKPVVADKVPMEDQKMPATPRQERVLAAKVDNPVSFVADKSSVSWREQGDKTLLTVEAIISGPVKSAIVEVDHYPIELQVLSKGVYHGEYLAFEPVNNFFSVVTMPTITITGLDGQVITANINWQTLKVVSPTPIQKYVKAKESLSSITNIFAVSKNIYFAFIIFFALALLLNIVIEIKKQHPHIILKTLGLLGLLICFWLV
ncbi:MAG: CAP domain-containing protein [Candidatus Komeilibacteria bacterium]|nr:CAP domain-containing protein [Candidatus Komeilibacteria bacterium]